MSRYIDAEKLAQKVLELEDKLTLRKTTEVEIQYCFLLNVVTPMIVSAPMEDVAPVAYAEWEDNGANYKCSNCGNTESYYDMLYCPHCGAKMENGD